MKKILFMAAVITVSMGLTACGSRNEENNIESGETESTFEEQVIMQETLSEEMESEESGSDGTEAAESEGLDNFDVEKQTFLDFAVKVKEAVAEKDMEKLSELVSFPTYVGFQEEGIVIEKKEDFMALDPERVFTPDMLISIEAADAEKLEASMAGFTLAKAYEEGIPSITYSMTGGRLGITGINY